MTKQQKLREEEVLGEMGTCVHFRGILNDPCEAGVNIRLLVGGPYFGWATRLPCLVSNSDKCEIVCLSRRLPTREEAESSVDEHTASLKRVLNTMAVAKAHAAAKGLGIGSGGSGVLPCPSECGGTLIYTVADVNGHMHATCSTKGCIRWME